MEEWKHFFLLYINALLMLNNYTLFDITNLICLYNHFKDFLGILEYLLRQYRAFGPETQPQSKVQKMLNFVLKCINRYI